MCLSIKVNHPECILAEGSHEGFEWTVVHNQMGYRCGYVRIPQGHPWHGKDYDAVDARAHGGLTFAEPDLHCDKGGPDDAWWLGFDCAHSGDAQDPELPTPHYMATFGRGVVRTQAYVEEECRDLCKQAAAAAN